MLIDKKLQDECILNVNEKHRPYPTDTKYHPMMEVEQIMPDTRVGIQMMAGGQDFFTTPTMVGFSPLTLV